MQIEIISDLKYTDLRDGERVRLLDEFCVMVNMENLVCVAKGFISDLASVPWPFRRTFPRFGPWNAAAIVHDWLYFCGEIAGEKITRRQADRIFLGMMRANPHVGVRAWPMYIAVRAGGWWAWREHRKGIL